MIPAFRSRADGRGFAARAPPRENSIHDGEPYDARLEKRAGVAGTISLRRRNGPAVEADAPTGFEK